MSRILTVFEVAASVLSDIEYHLDGFEIQDQKRCEGTHEGKSFLDSDGREYTVYLTFGLCINSTCADPEWYDKFADSEQLIALFRESFSTQIRPIIEEKSQMSEEQLREVGINPRTHTFFTRIVPEWRDPDPESGRCIEAVGFLKISYEYFIPA